MNFKETEKQGTVENLKPILFFIAKFFVTYIVLTVLYSYYLTPYLEVHKIADPFTKWTSDAVAWLMNQMGFVAESIQYKNETFMQFVLDGEEVSKVNEGCNSVSVMIIFVSFVVAFSQKIGQTGLYILVGLGLMLAANLSRIVLLNYIIRYMPSYAKSAHDYLFPAIIYGMVVVLWLAWVQFFVLKKK